MYYQRLGQTPTGDALAKYGAGLVNYITQAAQDEVRRQVWIIAGITAITVFAAITLTKVIK